MSISANNSQSPQEVSAPLDALWKTSIILWIMVVGEGLAIVLALAPGIERPSPKYFILLSSAVQWAIISTLTVLYLLRNWLNKFSGYVIGIVTLLSLLLNSLVVAFAAWLTFDGIWTTTDKHLSFLLLRVAIIVSIVGIFGFVSYHVYWKSRQLLIQTKEAELQALHARIHPHFLFNTLNTAIELIQSNPSKAESTLLDLSDLFRATLSLPKNIPLADELSLTERYLKIETLRLGSRLVIDWEMPNPIPDIQVPILSLQPLAENAVRYGVEPSPEGGAISIIGLRSANTFLIRISNSLPRQSIDRLIQGHQIGLTSAKARIHAISKGTAHVDVLKTESEHIVTISFPLTSTPR